jgi:predicted GH43/DUF377 family glycosyl hydrolase
MQHLLSFTICLVVGAACLSESSCLAVYAETEPPVTAVKRLSEKPILEPSSNEDFRNSGAFNPTAAEFDGQIWLLFRAQNKAGISSIGKATSASADGLTFNVDSRPLLSQSEPYEVGGGLEDPRLVRIKGRFYLTYTGYNGKDAQLCLSTSTDLVHWHRHGVIMPAYQGTWNKQWTKSGAIVPRKINGKYWMYYLGTASGADQMGLAESADLLHWHDATEMPVLPRRENQFDSKVVEPGPAPILTDEGILLLYNGADDKLVYRLGWVLFDKNDPSKVLARAEKPIFEPEKEWEKKGQVPNVVFVEGCVQHGDRLRLYYGAADKCTGVAELTLRKP